MIHQTKTFVKDKKRRRGVHAKTKHSKNKNSRFYTKKYKGQGKN